MPSKILSGAIVGLDAQLVEVEVDFSVGLHSFNIVGLPDAAVNESRERVSYAVKNSNFSPPHHTNRRVLVNLAPADLKKEGSLYDLPIAVAYLLSSGQITSNRCQNALFIGELSLEGSIRPICGVLSLALMAREKGIKTIFAPKDNAKEAALIRGIKVIPSQNLARLVAHLEGKEEISPQPPTIIFHQSEQNGKFLDFSHIIGQEHAKRAIEIAAAGGHNVLMSGPPGAGKTMLARAMLSITPPLTSQESLEVTKIYSISGRLSKDQYLVSQRPFRSPHHTASGVALVGGGNFPRPGEITLAHRGILFLDEFPEFHRDVLENLRQPLEDGQITVSRASSSLTFPARFTLIAAMNPCPCGNSFNPGKQCLCTPLQIARYKRRISGPLLDRIDIHLEVPQVKYEKLLNQTAGSDSFPTGQRVILARQVQEQRFQKENILLNSEMNIEHLKKYCILDRQSKDLLKNALLQMKLSARAFHRILKISRTIADIESRQNIEPRHIAEAIQYRPKIE